MKDRLSRLVAALLDGAVAAYRRRVRRSAPPGHRRHMVGFAAAHTVFFVLLAVLYGQMRRERG